MSIPHFNDTIVVLICVYIYIYIYSSLHTYMCELIFYLFFTSQLFVVVLGQLFLEEQK